MSLITANVSNRSFLFLVFAAGTLAVQTNAVAGPFLTDKAFDLTVNVGGSYNSGADSITGGNSSLPVGFTNVEDLFNKTQNNGLSQVNALYTINSASVIRFGYRGLPMVLVTQANSTNVQLLIPSIGEVVTFQAKTTRDANVNDLKDYLKNAGGDILNRLQQSLAANSPIDPIAGNPNSMQTRMVDGDFDRNFTQFASNIKAEAFKDGSEPTSNLIGVGVGYGSYTQAGLSSNVVTLPLSYTTRPDLDPRRQLTLYAPITVTDVAGAKSYGVNFGVSYRVPVNDEWALTPSLGYGVSGSADLGSAAAMMTASLTSQYTLRMDGYDLAIGNMVGLYKSSKFAMGDYSFDPQINNTVFRNGVMASFPTSIQGKKMAYEFSFVNTLYTGTALYSNQSNEIGVTLGTNKGANSARSYLRAGVTYLVAQNDIRGFKLNIGYWF
jgi:hypothetical protein